MFLEDFVGLLGGGAGQDVVDRGDGLEPRLRFQSIEPTDTGEVDEVVFPDRRFLPGLEQEVEGRGAAGRAARDYRVVRSPRKRHPCPHAKSSIYLQLRP